MGRATSKTFAALRVYNFRLYTVGQLISISGTWMQGVAQSWLVLKLTGSAVDLGVAAALAFVPILLFGPYGGLIVDRLPKRPLLVVTQASAGLLALGLGLLVSFGHASVADVFVFAFLLGVVNLFDMPARQAFVQEMVGRDLLPNAVSLNSVLVNAGRIMGPAVGGLVIAAFGVGTCFLINAGSFVAVIVALLAMRAAELLPIARVERERGQVRAGLRYAAAHPEIRAVLVAVALVGIFAFNYNVTLALLAKKTFHGSAALLGWLSSMVGVGAVLGGLAVAHRSRPTLRLLTTICLAFTVAIVLVTVAPTEPLAFAAMVPLGATSIAFIATANATLQLAAEEDMRGRVMALYTVGFLGTTPVGAPLVGWLAQAFGPRAAIASGGVATLLAALLLARARREPEAEERLALG
jgi:MFS family permease